MPLFVLGAAFGGLSFALYPLCVAHANDRLLAAERVAASGQLVLLYSVGAAFGPIGAAGAMTAAGTGGLFLFIAVCAAAMLAFGLWRLAAADPVPEAGQQDFRILPRTTPVSALLDPARDARVGRLPAVAVSPRRSEHDDAADPPTRTSDGPRNAAPGDRRIGAGQRH